MITLVHHAPGRNSQRLLHALQNGLNKGTVPWQAYPALQADPQWLNGCKGLLLMTPENFGYMSGALKHFFDTVFYPVEHSLRGLPVAVCIHAGKDGTGTARSIRPICDALGWRLIADPLIVRGDVSKAHDQHAQTLAETLSTGVEMGIF